MARLLLLVALCGSCSFGGQVSLNRAASAPKPPDASCEVLPPIAGESESLLMGLRLRQEESAIQLACDANEGPTRHSIAVISGVDASASVEQRLIEAFPPVSDDREWGATGPHTSAPAVLSGNTGVEHRQPADRVTPRLFVIRYVQRGDAVYAAWIMGRPTEMAASESNNAAWLDAVRFADLEKGR